MFVLLLVQGLYFYSVYSLFYNVYRFCYIYIYIVCIATSNHSWRDRHVTDAFREMANVVSDWTAFIFVTF